MIASATPSLRAARGTRPPSFVHDLNTCVGCQACAIACVNENQLEPGRFWRQIVTHNPARAPHAPTFHLSLACNHCLDAPCLRSCPALAIVRDERTGAVIIDGDHCIGCRYCSWVCPYDAPRFNDQRGVMEKCTLCVHRLVEGMAPACVSLCPTGALRVGEYDAAGCTDVTGFPQFDAQPSIRFVPLAGRVPLPAVPAALTPVPGAGAVEQEWVQEDPRPKISARHEWTLVTFTLIAIVLVAWWSAAALRATSVPPLPFLALGVGGMALSTLHLGRRERAWRATLNWRRSWLSREVLAYSAFVGLAVLSMLVPAAHRVLAVAAAVAGVACVLCIDRVYGAMALRGRAVTDEVAATTSAAFLLGVVGAQPWLAGPAGVLRVVGALWRTRLHGRTTATRAAWVAACRVLVGVVAPAALWIWGGGGLRSIVVALAILGEGIDRWTFYDALDVVTPRAEMASSRHRP